MSPLQITLWAQSVLRSTQVAIYSARQIGHSERCIAFAQCLERMFYPLTKYSWDDFEEFHLGTTLAALCHVFETMLMLYDFEAVLMLFDLTRR